MRRKSSRSNAKSSEESASGSSKRSDTPKKPTRSSKRLRRSTSRSGDESEEEPTVEHLATIEEVKSAEKELSQHIVGEVDINQESNDPKPDKNENLSMENLKQDAEVNVILEESKGKSKELTSSQNEQSSNNIEPETEHEHVQGTPKSPSKDNADQNINDSQCDEAQNSQHEEEPANEAAFESGYVQDDNIGNVDENSQSSLKSEERSLTPEIKGRRKITLKRITRDKTKSTDERSNENNYTGEENPTRADATNMDEKDQKSSRRITLKRRVTITQDKSEEIEESKVISNEITENGSSRRSSAYKDDEENKQTSSSSEDKPQPVEATSKPPARRIRLIRTVSHEPKKVTAMDGEVKPRRKWSAVGSAEWLKQISETLYKIDVDSIKIVCPKMKFLSEEDVKLESIPPRERFKSESEKVKRKASMEDGEQRDTSDEHSDASVIALNRRISIVDDTQENTEKPRAPPSPATNPTTEVLFIKNLVRPFTVKQLRELLEKTGTIEKDGFWTDRIKSKCYVRYTRIEDAEATRAALHGEFWPVGNGKKLFVDFSTFEEMDKVMNPPVIVIPDPTPEKENREPEKETKYKPVERLIEAVPRKRDAPVREWDIGKEQPRRRSRTRTPSRERVRKHSRRSYTPEIHNKKKPKRNEEPAPLKLMDDLFSKTKATPSIYWQPLSPEEIAKKIHQRLVRMEEHKRRIEETRGRGRDNRRNNYRRR